MLEDGIQKLGNGLWRYRVDGDNYYIRHKRDKRGFCYETSSFMHEIGEYATWLEAINSILEYHTTWEVESGNINTDAGL